MNGSPVTLRQAQGEDLMFRQAQGEDLMLSLSKHEVRDKESRFPKSRITRQKGSYVARLKTQGKTSAEIAMMQRRCARDVQIECLLSPAKRI